MVINPSMVEIQALRDSQQASTSPWGFPVLRSLRRNTCFYSTAWKIEHLPRKYSTFAFMLDLGNGEAVSPMPQSMGNFGLMDTLQ